MQGLAAVRGLVAVQQGLYKEPDYHAVNQECSIWSCGAHMVGSERQEQTEPGTCKEGPTGNPLGLSFTQSEGQGGSVHGLCLSVIPAQALCPLEKAYTKQARAAVE